jgi:hypothetical protein
MAASMWTEWQQLHHEGSVSFAEEEPSLVLGPGKTINLTGGLAEWATMAAMITRVTEAFASGVTTTEFGVPGWLDLDSRVAWYRSCRTRRYSYSRTLRDATADDGGGGVTETQSLRDHADVSEIVRRRIFDPAAEVQHEIDLDSGAFAFATAAHGETARVVKPVEVLIPYDDAGTIKAKRCQILGSDLYGDAVALGGLPAGTVTGQIIYWNHTTGLWTVSAVGTLASGDILQWDGSKYVKLTPTQITAVTAWRLDKTNHKYQTKTRTAYVLSPGAESAWTDVPDADGGILDPGIIAF